MSSVTLGELVDIKGGGTPDKKVPDYWGGNIPWASVKDFKSTSLSSTIDRITQAGVTNSATQVIPAGNIIVPTRMAVGKAAINEIDLAINQDLKALIPSQKIDRQYLLHALLANAKTLEDQATGATVKGIKLDVLRSLKIPLPPLEKQRRIAGILDQADALRRLRTRALDKLNTLGQAIFHEMFGDPNTNIYGLPVTNIEGLCQTISDCLHKTPEHTTDVPSYPSVRSPDLQAGFVDLDKVKRVPFETYVDRIQRHKPVAGDVIYCREGARYGNCGMVPEGVDLCLGQRTMLFQARSGNITPEYLWATLCSPWLRKQADMAVGGAASPHVNIKDIRKFTCLLPPYDTQLTFSHRIATVFKGRTQALKAIKSSDALFASLQHRAFRGEL